jgi:hypothetical protein
MNGEAVVTSAQAVAANVQAVVTSAQAVAINAQAKVFVPVRQLSSNTNFIFDLISAIRGY